MEEKEKNEILKITKAEQYRTVDELLEKSKANANYYTLLVLSSLIIAAGLILDSPAVVIGGMLVTPVLTPVLALALGISASQISFLKRDLILLGKSFLIILASAFLVAVIFGTKGDSSFFTSTFKTATLYFLVAFVSGIAATFAWTKKELSEVLPGIAISVALVPPLSLIGIALSLFNFESARFHFFVFIFNFIGIVMGSLIIFSLLKFHRTEKKISQEIKKEEKAEVK